MPIICRKLLTRDFTYNIITQCDELRNCLAKSPGMAVERESMKAVLWINGLLYLIF